MATPDTHASEDALRRALVALKDLKQRVERSEQAAAEPIAVIGAGCRFPGGASTPEAFWALLRAGRDAIRDVPASRWNHRDYFDPDPDAPGKVYTDQGGFLDEAVDQFDAAFFGIAPVEARTLDPQQRLLLEVAWEALEHAGIAPDSLVGSATGVFVGMGTTDYSTLQLQSTDRVEIGRYYGTGAAPSVAAGRISYLLGLRGPTLALDTACSSSLVAAALAMQGLRAGTCRMAIVGGVNLMLDPQPLVFLSRFRALSPTGRCHTFGAAADGYVRAEGAGAVVLKRLSDAVADGDRIMAVLRGAAINHDGRSSGLTVPSGPAQREVLELALADARLQASDVDLLEAHGTGTELGDPIEVRAVDAVYSAGRPRSQPLLLGSAKTNLGHLEAAAGMAGLLKVVLAMQHDEIPPHVLDGELSPHLDWASMPIEVPRQVQPWPRTERPRRAGVSGFGLSGTNAHLIVEEAPPVPARPAAEDRPVVVTLAARDDHALRELATETAKSLEREERIADVAWTSQVGRAGLAHRLAVTASSPHEAANLLEGWTPETVLTGVSHGVSSPSAPPLAFVFSGQGAQRPAMGRDLYEHEPVFRQVMDDCDRLLQPHLPVALLDVLYSADAETADLVHQTQYTQPALFAVQCALAALWRSWGVEPSAVVGHSIGEYAAAVVAGVMDLEVAAALIAARGRLMGQLPVDGSMVAVLADEDVVRRRIEPFRDEVSVAAVNGPNNVVISGVTASIDQIVAGFGTDVTHRRLAVSHAFHSPLMAPMVDEFAAAARAGTYREPMLPFLSTVTGAAEGIALATPEYWRDHVLATVRFGDAVQALHQSGIAHFVEIGPQPSLLGAVGRAAGADVGLHASLRPRGDRDERAQIADAVGRLWTAGVEIDWRAIDGGRSAKVELPTYPFQRQRHWLPEAAAPAAPPHRAGPAIHPLLHERLDSPAISGRVYQAELSTADPAYLADHRAFGVTLMPATGYLEMALAAGRDAFGPSVALAQVTFQEMLVLVPGEARRVQVVLDEVAGGTSRFTVHSAGNGHWTAHASGVIELAPAPRAAPGPDPDESATETCDAGDHYRRVAERGVDYGPEFRVLSSIVRATRWASGRLQLSDQERAAAAGYLVHPVLLDGCFHLLQAADPDGDADTTYLPVGIASYWVDAAAGAAVHATVRIAPHAADAEVRSADVEMRALDGTPVAALHGLKLRRVESAVVEAHARRAAGSDDAAAADLFYEPQWTPLPATVATDTTGDWLVIGAGELALAIATELEQRGQRAVVAATVDAAPEGEWAGTVVILAPPAGGHPDPVAGQRPVLEAVLTTAQRILARDLALRTGGRLWLVTRNGQSVNLQADPVDLTQAPVWGLANVLTLEEPNLRVAGVDLAPRGTGDDAAVVDELLAGSDEDRIAHRGGHRYGLRLSRTRPDQTLTIPDGAYALEVVERGTLDGVLIAPAEVAAPGPGEVVIEVRASGLNFRDVLNVMGLYPGDPGEPGSECSGIVTAVGAGVEHIATGDAVIALAAGFKRYVTAPAGMVFALPPALDFAAGASVPIAFLTAHHALHGLADVQAGDVVFVHAAAGGVGRAAVELARRAGATVIGTAGSEEKRSLLRSLGVEHVFDSRSLDFAPAVLEVTGGRGVDVALNSLSDAFIPATLGIVAEHGWFVEIGKRGIWTEEQVAAGYRTVRYRAFDLADVIQDHPEQIRSMMSDLLGGLAAGELRPLPLRCVPLGDIRGALRHMAMARHVGKIVITQSRSLAGEGSFLVTGGLGALGLEAARSLAARGARHIALLGRRPPSGEVAAAIDELGATGVAVTVHQGDVSDPERVHAVLAEIRAASGPLRGVVHAAGVVDDGLVRDLDWSRFDHVMAAKVAGAWNLHRATLDDPIELFVMYSSAAALLGSIGQANYAAANAFLDGLAHHRQATGRPALSINWGGWAAIGMVSQLDANQQARLVESGMGLIDPTTGDQALGALVGGSAAQVGVLPIDWRVVAERTPAAMVRPFLQALVSAAGSAATAGRASATDFTDELAELDVQDRYDFVRDHVRAAIVAVLGLDGAVGLDGDRGLPDMGMDSLMAVELCNRLQRSTGVPLDSTVAFEWPSLEALSRHLAHDRLGIPTDTTDQPSDRQARNDQEAVERLAEVEAISDLEAEAFLLDALERSGY